MTDQPGRIVSGERTLALDEMRARALRAARGLEELGVKRDDSVAVYLRNDFPFFEAAYAAERLGVHLVPINWHFSGSEVAYILEDSGAKALIAHADLLEPIREQLPDEVRLFVVETPREIASAYACLSAACQVQVGDTSWGDWLETFDPLPAATTPSPGSMIYTSGTTGRPKGVRRKPPTDQEIAGMGEMINLIMDFSQDNIVALITAPMYHATPNGFFSARGGRGCGHRCGIPVRCRALP